MSAPVEAMHPSPFFGPPRPMLRLVAVCLLTITATLAVGMQSGRIDGVVLPLDAEVVETTAEQQGCAAESAVRDPVVVQTAARTTAPACLVRGVVRTESGDRVDGVTLFLAAADASWRRTATTDAAGHFAFPGTVGGQVLMVPPVDNHVAHTHRFELTTGGVELVVTLRERSTRRLAGRILDASGCPLGTRVEATMESAGREPVHCAADAGGYFEVPDAPLGRVVVRTTAPVRTEIRDVRLNRTDAGYVELRLDLGRQVYRGRVESTRGVPLAGASVHLERAFEAAPGVSARSFRTAHTDVDGRYAFHDLGPGTGTLTVMASGYTTTLADVPADRMSSHIVRLDRIELEERGKNP